MNIDWLDRLKHDPEKVVSRFQHSLVKLSDGTALELLGIRPHADDDWCIIGQQLVGGLVVPIKTRVNPRHMDFSWPTPKVVSLGPKAVGYLSMVAGHKARRGFYRNSMILAYPSGIVMGGDAHYEVEDYDMRAWSLSAYYNAHAEAESLPPEAALHELHTEGSYSFALGGPLWMGRSGVDGVGLVYLRSALVGVYRDGVFKAPMALFELREQFGRVFPNIDWKETD